MDEIHLGRKERERIFRRKEIMDAAVRFFAEKGFSLTTLEEIADAAEYGKGTIYNYFQNKEEIYTAIIEDVVENNQRMIVDADNSAKSFVEFLTIFTENLFEFCIQNKYSFLIFVREIAQLNTEYLNINRDAIFNKYCAVSDVMLTRINSAIKNKEIKKLDPERIRIIYNHMVFPYIHYFLVCNEYKSTAKEELITKGESEFILTVLFEGILNK